MPALNAARSARAQTPSCSRFSTTCSCPLPSRWGFVSSRRHIRSISRNGSIFRAPFSTGTAISSPMPRLSPRTWARWGEGSKPGCARTPARCKQVVVGWMGESVKTVMRENAGQMEAGDVYVINDPYHGGTHLPDITVITPVFSQDGKAINFYVGSRGHHADIGGIT